MRYLKILTTVLLVALSWEVARAQVGLAGFLPPHLEAVATDISDDNTIVGWLIDLNGRRKGWSLNFDMGEVSGLETEGLNQQTAALGGSSNERGRGPHIAGTLAGRPALWEPPFHGVSSLALTLPQKGFFSDAISGGGQAYAALTTFAAGSKLWRIEGVGLHLAVVRFFPLDGDERFRPVRTARISPKGDIAGQLLDRHSGKLVAGFWRRDQETTSFRPLPALHPGGWSEALAIDRQRTVVGWSEDANGDWVATMWSRRGQWQPERIGLQNLGVDSQANDIDNNIGIVVGVVGLQAFRWLIGEPDLFPLPSPPNAEYAEAMAVNYFGKVVGYASINNRLTPIIW